MWCSLPVLTQYRYRNRRYIRYLPKIYSKVTQQGKNNQFRGDSQ